MARSLSSLGVFKIREALELTLQAGKGAPPAASPGGIQRYMSAETSIIDNGQGSPKHMKAGKINGTPLT